MKTCIKTLAALFIGATFMFSCQNAEETMVQSDDAATRAYGDKTPKLCVYVETNDINPLNAGDYCLGTSALVDVVELFASNIHKQTVDGQVQPTLYLNDKLTRVLEPDPVTGEYGYEDYVVPLQEKGIKVLLTVLGDWQDIGVSTMTPTQTDQFAAILAYTVNRYGLDGIGFDDEYNGYGAVVNSTSYSDVITKLHANPLMAGKIITVFDWGATYTINSAASACIDYGYHGVFNPTYFEATPGIGLNNARWSPISINLGDYNTPYLSNITTNSLRAKNQGYGAIMNFNLRNYQNVDPLPVFNAIAVGAYGGNATRCGNGNRPQDWPFIGTGYTITYADTL